MRKLLFVLSFLAALPVMAQDACIQDEKQHYFVATGTTKTTMSEPLKAVLTPQEQLIWINTYRNFSITSPAHKDLTACNEALLMLESQRAIAPKNGIHAVQSVSYDGYCLPVEVCP